MSKLAALIPLLVVLGACADQPLPGSPDPDADARADLLLPPPPANLQMYWTCGDPVCSGWTPKGLHRCKKQEGDPCKNLGHECDPHDACNATLVCSDVDPIGPGGCPI